MGSEELRKELFDDERIAAVRNDVARLMEAERLSAAAVGKEADIGGSTVQAFVKGSYNGDNAEQALKLARWLGSRQARARTETLQRRAPGFVLTPTSKAISAVLEHAQFSPDLCVVVGEPGVGKTSTLMQYANQTSNVFVLTAEPTGSSARALLEDMAEEVGVSAAGMGGQRLSKALVRKLRGSAGLVAVDEAQHLSSVALDQLRTIHDLSGVGIALLGNPAIYVRLEGGGKRTQFAQLYSRVGMRVNRKAATPGDVVALLDAWGLEDAGARKLCAAVARTGGALRSMTKTLRQAYQRADAEGAAVSEAHVLAAAQQLGAAPREDAA